MPHRGSPGGIRFTTYTLTLSAHSRPPADYLPTRASCCGLPAALSVTVRVPSRGTTGTAAGGVYVTLIVQVPTGFGVPNAWQVVVPVSAKLVPIRLVIVSAVMVTGATAIVTVTTLVVATRELGEPKFSVLTPSTVDSVAPPPVALVKASVPCAKPVPVSVTAAGVTVAPV